MILRWFKLLFASFSGKFWCFCQIVNESWTISELMRSWCWSTQRKTSTTISALLILANRRSNDVTVFINKKNRRFSGIKLPMQSSVDKSFIHDKSFMERSFINNVIFIGKVNPICRIICGFIMEKVKISHTLCHLRKLFASNTMKMLSYLDC